MQWCVTEHAWADFRRAPVRVLQLLLTRFSDKTRNDWYDRDNFVKVQGKYDLVAIDYSVKVRRLWQLWWHCSLIPWEVRTLMSHWHILVVSFWTAPVEITCILQSNILTLPNGPITSMAIMVTTAHAAIFTVIFCGHDYSDKMTAAS